jgi:copper oxidase (laccase) domain-containing protein
MMHKMIQAMQQRGANNISVYIGPCISGQAYPVLQDRVAAFARLYPQFRSRILTSQDHQWYLDIGLLNQLQAEEAGAGSVERLNVCTFTQPEQFYSFRHEGAELSGQLLHTVMLRS